MSGKTNELFLVGMGGIGKSEIAKAYCELYREEYEVILWISFDGSLQKTITNDFAFPIEGFERSDYPENSDRDYFLRKIKVLKQIATRYQSLCKNIPGLSIEEVTEEADLLAMFQTEYKKSLEGTLETVKELLKLLNGHPLSIRLVASAMQSRRILPEKMLQLLSSGTSALKKQNVKAADMIFNRLKQVFSLAALTGEERHLLKNLALLPLQGIPVEVLYEWCDLDDFDVIDDLVQKSWVVHNPASDEVHLHPLIADLMIEELEKDFDSCTKLLETLREKQEKLIRTKYTERKLIAACFASVCERLPQGHPGKWDVMWGRAVLISAWSLYEQSVGLFSELLEQTEGIEKRLKVYNKISQGYCLGGNPEVSIEFAQKCLDEIDAIPPEELPEYIRSWKKEIYIRIAEANQHLGNYDIAINYALEGNIYRAMGNEEEALRYYGKAKEVILSVKHKKYEKILEEIVKSGQIGYIS